MVVALPLPEGPENDLPAQEQSAENLQQEVYAGEERFGVRVTDRFEVEPTENSLHLQAAQMQVAILDRRLLQALSVLHIVSVSIFGLIYAWFLTDLLGVEGFFRAFLAAGVALVFTTLSILLRATWAWYARSLLLEDLPQMWSRLVGTVALSLAWLAVDFGASWFIIHRAFYTGSLGSRVPMWVVWALAGMSGGAQILGFVVGYIEGRRQEVKTAYLEMIYRLYKDALDQLVTKARVLADLLKKIAVEAARHPALRGRERFR